MSPAGVYQLEVLALAPSKVALTWRAPGASTYVTLATSNYTAASNTTWTQPPSQPMTPNGNGFVINYAVGALVCSAC